MREYNCDRQQLPMSAAQWCTFHEQRVVLGNHHLPHAAEVGQRRVLQLELNGLVPKHHPARGHCHVRQLVLAVVPEAWCLHCRHLKTHL